MQKVLFILGEMSDDDIDWMLEMGMREYIHAGEVLIHEGKPVSGIYVLLEGKLSVSVAKFGNKEIAQLSSGEVVGEMSFVDARPPSATVTALEDSYVFSVPRPRLSEKLRQDSGFASRFYRALAILLSNRLRVTVSQLGYGNDCPTEPPKTPSDLDAYVSESVLLAQARFDWLLRRLKTGSQSGSSEVS